MAKKTDSFSDIFSGLKEHIALTQDMSIDTHIPNIIDFCYSKHYLNLKSKIKGLYKMQEIILKAFYRGQKGNENIKLTNEELQLLSTNKQFDVLDKYNNDEIFNELILVLGRRAGKDFMTSLMALYEAMKILECPGGSFYNYYGISHGNPAYILTIANSADQARVLFYEIKNKMSDCEYFKNKIGFVESDKIWLLTPEDRKLNQDRISRGLNPEKGSVCIMSGHSNSDALLGKGYWTLLFDEVASFKTTGSAQSGERLYDALLPGRAAFNKPIFVENGKKTTDPKHPESAIPLMDSKGLQKRQLDSKVISISSPRSEEGIFYKMYSDTPNVKNRVAFRLPTWKVNESITEDLLRDQNKYMSAQAFAMEFGAEFSGTAGEKFIPNEYVDAAMKLGMGMQLDQRVHGRAGMMYYAHLDPASTSHNYALIVLHAEDVIQIREKENGIKIREKTRIYVVDHIKFWTPSPKKAINVYEVDKYIIDLAKRFRFSMVTYDSFNSMASVQKLRHKGIPSKVTPFRKAYKMKIYNELEHLLVNNQLALPNRGQYHHQLEMELKCLKRIYTAGQGFKIKPDPEGAVTTDDLCDALAGAIGSAMENIHSGYAHSTNVYMPHSRDVGNQWSIGRGVFSSNLYNSLHKKGLI